MWWASTDCSICDMISFTDFRKSLVNISSKITSSPIISILDFWDSNYMYDRFFYCVLCQRSPKYSFKAKFCLPLVFVNETCWNTATPIHLNCICATGGELSGCDIDQRAWQTPSYNVIKCVCMCFPFLFFPSVPFSLDVFVLANISVP